MFLTFINFFKNSIKFNIIALNLNEYQIIKINYFHYFIHFIHLLTFLFYFYH